MTKTLFIAVTVGAILLGSSAMGQVTRDTDYYPYGFSVKGGLFLPFDNDLSDVDTIWGSLGVEYSLGSNLFRGSETFLTADWMFRTTNSSINVFPLAINQRFWGGPGSSLFGGQGRSFFSVGVGTVFVEHPKAQGRWMVRGSVGTTLGERTFLEGTVFISDTTQDHITASGATFTVGYRF